MSLDTLHWLRPLWLLGIVPLVVAWWWVICKHRSANAWEAWVDPELQPYVLTNESTRSNASTHGWFAVWLLGLLVLAGPVWEQQPVPVFEARPSLVLVVDVSPSMALNDLPPTRMQRAVFKVSDFLNQAKGVEVGLLVFAERPYVVSPLTDDMDTLQAFLPSVSTELAPVPGSQLHLAIPKAVELLQQAGKPLGQIVVLTDSVMTDLEIDAAQEANDAGYRVSILGVGTANGAPLRNSDGNFVRDLSGAVVVPKVDIDELRRVASAGGGISTLITRGSEDIDAVLSLSNTQLAEAQTNGEASGETPLADYWVEYGVWLLPGFLLLALSLFRRGLAL